MEKNENLDGCFPVGLNSNESDSECKAVQFILALKYWFGIKPISKKKCVRACVNVRELKRDYVCACVYGCVWVFLCVGLARVFKSPLCHCHVVVCLCVSVP